MMRTTDYNCSTCFRQIGEGIAIRTLDYYGHVLCVTCGVNAGMLEDEEIEYDEA